MVPTPVRTPWILAAAIVAVSLAPIFVRLADAPGVVVAAYRMAIAALIIVPLTLRGLRRTRLTRATAVPTLWAGVLLAVHFATWITSLSFTTVAASVTLVATVPLWMALFSWWFLGRAPSLGTLIGVLVAIAGGATIAFGDAGAATASRPLLGDALALIGAISVTGYLMLGRTAQRAGLGLNAYTGLAYAVAALLLLPLPFMLGMPYLAYTPETFLWIAALALIPQLVGHTGINFAMKHLDPTMVSTTLLLEPVGAAVLALVLFGEVPSWLTIAGAGILLLGLVLTVRTGSFGRPARPRPAS